MSTLKDVAKMAGVSASTVSYVLNGKKKVRPETLEKINEAIRELNYQPNLLASSLKTNQSKTVGLVVSDLKSLFFVDILASIEAELGRQGYCMTVCNADNRPAREMECLNQLASRNIYGLILIGTVGRVLYDTRDQKIPMLCIDRVSNQNLLTVMTDNELGGYLGARHLVAKGYRKIVFLACGDMRFAEERYIGYQRAMAEAGLETMLWEQKSLDWEETCRMVQARVQTVRSAGQTVQSCGGEDGEFDAVFGCTDYIAIGVLKGLLRSGVSVPEQVGVLGFDDIAPSKFTIPELSSVAQPKKQIGIMAVRSLMKLLRGEEIREKQILLQPEVIERESSNKT